MKYIPTPTTKDLRLVDPDLRDYVRAVPDTLETAQTAEVAVNFMRCLPPKLHEDDRIVKIDIYVSTDDAVSDQPPSSIRIYIPRTVRDKQETVPVVLWSHHGGFFSAGASRFDPFATEIAVDSNVVVIITSWRQTPEHPFPAPFNDVYQVLRWIAESPDVKKYNIDPTNISVGGTSAGGAVAFGCCLKYRDEGRDTSAIKLLVIEDGTITDEYTSYSTFHNPINKGWNTNLTRYMWEMYIPRGSASLDPVTRGYAVPYYAINLKGLPSTLLLCAQWDNLTNDAIKFAHRLLENGIPTEIHNYRGTFHVSDKLFHPAKSSVRRRRDIVDALRSAFYDE